MSSYNFTELIDRIIAAETIDDLASLNKELGKIDVTELNDLIQLQFTNLAIGIRECEIKNDNLEKRVATLDQKITLMVSG